MIVSTGIDLVDIRRIKNTIKKYNFRFKKKCFHEGEIRKSEFGFKLLPSVSNWI